MAQPARPQDDRERRAACDGTGRQSRARRARCTRSGLARPKRPDAPPRAGRSAPRQAATIRCWPAWCCSASCWSARPRPRRLTAGLPLEDGRLTPALAVRAAARAGLAARLVRRPLERISDLTLPCILLLEGRDACVLVARCRRAGDRGTARDRRPQRAGARRSGRSATAATPCSRVPSCASTAQAARGPTAAPRQLVLGHAGAGLADLWRGRAGRGPDQPVRAGRTPVHHERLRPRRAEPRHRDALGAGGRRADGVPVRFPAAQPARLFRRQRRADRRRQARQPDLRAGAGPADGGAACQRRRVRQQPARVREPARLSSPRRPWWRWSTCRSCCCSSPWSGCSAARSPWCRRSRCRW